MILIGMESRNFTMRDGSIIRHCEPSRCAHFVVTQWNQGKLRETIRLLLDFLDRKDSS